MANTNSLFGFIPIGRLGGGPLQANMYAKSTAESNALFINDIVAKSAVSVADPHGYGQAYPGIASLATANTQGTTRFLGSVVSYGAAATATVHAVLDHPETVFIAQCDDATVLTVADHVGKNSNIIHAAGDATTKVSNQSIDGSAIATTATFDLRLLRIHDRVGNAAGAYAIMECIILRHFFAQGAGGTGGPGLGV